MKRIGLRIAETRNARGLSQESLAEAVGVSRSAVSQWESGGTPALQNIVEVAAYLGVDPGWLAFGSTSEEIGPLLQRMTPQQREAWIAIGKALVAHSDETDVSSA